MRGVVDLELEQEAESGQVVGLGEVKGEGEGLYQLIAAIQGHRNKNGRWPVGFVAAKGDLQLVEALECRKHVLVTLTSFTTTGLDHLLSFTEQLVQVIDTQHLIEATEYLTLTSPSRVAVASEERPKAMEERLEAMDKRQQKYEGTLATVVKGLARVEEAIRELADLCCPCLHCK